MSKTTREILIEARELITPPENWSGPAYHEHDSHCYCAATAIWQAANERPYGATSSVESVPAGDAIARVAGVRLPSSSDDETGTWEAIYDWNDHATHERVLNTFDQAIEETS